MIDSSLGKATELVLLEMVLGDVDGATGLGSLSEGEAERRYDRLEFFLELLGRHGLRNTSLLKAASSGGSEDALLLTLFSCDGRKLSWEDVAIVAICIQVASMEPDTNPQLEKSLVKVLDNWNTRSAGEQNG